MAGEPAWLTVDSEGERRHVRLDLKLTTIGRNEANVIDLPDKRLSRFHCEIERKGEEYVLRDAKSRNGTKLNGQRIDGSIVLGAGDTIEIGGSTLLFRTDRPIDADPGNNLVPIAPIPKSVRKATTLRRIDLSGQTPDDAFDPRHTIPYPAPALVPPPATKAAAGSSKPLADAIALLAEVASSEQVLSRLAQLALDLVPARQALVLLPSGQGTPPRVAAIRPLAAPGAAPEPRFSSAVVDEVLTTQHPVSVQDLKQDERWGIDYSVLGLDLRGTIAVPLRALGRVRGALYVDEPRAIGPEERAEAILSLGALADAAAAALVATGGTIANEDARAAAEAGRLARTVAEAQLRAVEVASEVRPARGAFVEAQAVERGGRRELLLLAGVATGSTLDLFRLEVAARAAFRALVRTVPRGDALLAALVPALGADLEGRALRAALVSLDAAGKLDVALAGWGPVVHRSGEGSVVALDSSSLALGATLSPKIEEHSIGWERGDLVLLVAPAPSDLALAPWLPETADLPAARVAARASAELPDASVFVALGRT